MKWEDHFNCVSRDKIVRQILRWRKEYDEMPPDGTVGKNWVHLSDKDNLLLLITAYEDLLR